MFSNKFVENFRLTLNTIFVSIYPSDDDNKKCDQSKIEEELEHTPPKPRKCQARVTLRRKRTTTIFRHSEKHKHFFFFAIVW